MGMDSINRIRLANRMFINATPVFKGDEKEEFCMEFNYVGAVLVRPVYVNSKARMIRRVGDRIYVSFPYGTDKETVMEQINSLALASRVRRYIRAAMKLSSYPTCNMTGSIDDGFIIIAGKRFGLRLIPSMVAVMAFEDDMYFFTYRHKPDSAVARYRRWRRDTATTAFSAALDRVCEINGFPKSKLKFCVTNGTTFLLKRTDFVHACIPEGTAALRPKELDSIALYFILTYDMKYSLEQIKTEYPFLYEVAFYVAKRLGLRLERVAMTAQLDRIYSDNYIARHGEKVYNVIDQIVAGKKVCSDKTLHLCSLVYAP